MEFNLDTHDKLGLRIDNLKEQKGEERKETGRSQSRNHSEII